MSKGFEIETEMTIHAVDKALRIGSVAVGYRDRPEGSVSKLNTLTDGLKVIMTIFRLYKNYRPLSFFSAVALVFFAFAGAFMAPVLASYFETGLVPKFPTLIVCGFAAMAGLQSFFGGMVLDTIVQRHRQDFEIKLTELASSQNSRSGEAGGSGQGIANG
jgi:hypothetical protein